MSPGPILPWRHTHTHAHSDIIESQSENRKERSSGKWKPGVTLDFSPPLLSPMWPIDLTDRWRSGAAECLSEWVIDRKRGEENSEKYRSEYGYYMLWGAPARHWTWAELFRCKVPEIPWHVIIHGALHGHCSLIVQLLQSFTTQLHYMIEKLKGLQNVVTMVWIFMFLYLKRDNSQIELALYKTRTDVFHCRGVSR